MLYTPICRSDTRNTLFRGLFLALIPDLPGKMSEYLTTFTLLWTCSMTNMLNSLRFIVWHVNCLLFTIYTNERMRHAFGAVV